MKIELTVEQVNVVLASLVKQPFEVVYQLIDNIRSQANAEIAKEQASDEKTSE